MPQKPNSPAPRMMENMTQKPLMPMELPSIFGPMTLPSSCCSTMMKMMNTRHLNGSTSRMISALGTAPMNGPKKGITFVTPTITLTSSAYGMFSSAQPM